MNMRSKGDKPVQYDRSGDDKACLNRLTIYTGETGASRSIGRKRLLVLNNSSVATVNGKQVVFQAVALGETVKYKLGHFSHRVGN